LDDCPHLDSQQRKPHFKLLTMINDQRFDDPRKDMMRYYKKQGFQ
jgi:hypothetical protein